MKKVKAGETTEDQRYQNPKKTKRTKAVIAAVAAAVQKDARVSVRELAQAQQLSTSTIFAILHDDLGLVKKSARWVPKLLSEEQKEERVRVCQKFTAAVRREDLGNLRRIVTMDESILPSL